MREIIKNVLVTGGAGYVGAVLVPKLLDRGYHVRVLDLYIYGKDVLKAVGDNPNLEEIKGDIRDRGLVEKALAGCDAVIHLACISNDPSFELDPALGKSINYDATLALIDSAKKALVKRFVFASSSSVYGVKAQENVTEDLPLEPLTDYSKYKAMCEEYLLKAHDSGFTVLVLRPATVCGYSPRQRLDLTVNILTNHAVNKRRITVFGGEQKRPNIHIDDVTDLYVKTLEYPKEKIAGKVFNAGFENQKVKDIARIVTNVVKDEKLEIVTEPTDDNRSYHISSEKIMRELGFSARRTIKDAITDLKEAFADGRIPEPMTDIRYYNIKTMQAIKLK
ncbi:MAG: NAD-dependent epimerase/dehydratase family protein [Candidatus Omnitrophota bacterium]